MEKNQYKTFVEVLQRMHKEGFLKDLLLIGSWCIPLYEDYFKNIRYPTTILTRDMDFYVPRPERVQSKIPLKELLKDLGFIEHFAGEEGYVQLMHPDLIVEFLALEKGKGGNKPYDLKGLGMNAQPLRLLNILDDKDVIEVKVEGIPLRIPHPVNFAFHKLLIASRRTKEEKAEKDRETAFRLFPALMKKGEQKKIISVYRSLSRKQQAIIRKELERADQTEILQILESNK